MDVSKLKISSLKTNTGQVDGLPKNPRLIRDDNFKKLVQSLRDDPEMLELREIIAYDNDGELVVICGNMRLKALMEIGEKETFVKVLPKETSIEKLKAYVIKDNVPFGEHSWEDLANEWDDLPLEDWGLDPVGFAKIGGGAEEDDYEIPDEIETDIVLGDLFQIGEHRLLCGDSTDSDQVAKLMGGEKFQVMATSPPYNQGNGTGDLLTNGENNVRLYDNADADNLSREDYYNFLIDILNTSYLFKDELHTICWNVSYNAKSRSDYGEIVFSKDNPYNVKETIIWDKGHSINLPQIGIYSRRCEFVFIMSECEKYRTTQVYNGSRWNIWDISSNKSQKTDGNVEHRAAFPVEFASKMVTDFAHEADIVYDPFLGSGTTMVAAHQLDRKCYGMEIDPKYCQVIIDRMKALDPDIEVKKL